MPLGSLLGPKTLKNLKFFKVFEKAVFWLFEAPDGLLGLILAASWADLVPKWVPKWGSKVVQKVIKKWTKK